MARKKVREYTGKRLLKSAMKRIANIDLPINVAQVKENTNFIELLEQHPWLNQTKLVVKPDMLFGQRGKNDLVGLNLTFAEAEEFINKRMGKMVTIKGCTGPVNTFVIEPFVPHKEEYYLCIQSNRLDIDVSFSTAGGVEIEENWDKVKTITIPTETAINSEQPAPGKQAARLGGSSRNSTGCTVCVPLETAPSCCTPDCWHIGLTCCAAGLWSVAGMPGIRSWAQQHGSSMCVCSSSLRQQQLWNTCRICRCSTLTATGHWQHSPASAAAAAAVAACAPAVGARLCSCCPARVLCCHAAALPHRRGAGAAGECAAAGGAPRPGGLHQPLPDRVWRPGRHAAGDEPLHPGASQRPGGWEDTAQQGEKRVEDWCCCEPAADIPVARAGAGS